jgi:hypothetical protein
VRDLRNIYIFFFVDFDSAVRQKKGDDSRIQGENSGVDKGVL